VPSQMAERLSEILRQRILVLDGAMGTMIQQKDLTAQDFGGPEYEGCNEYLNLTRPDVITSIHESYFAAGADIVETNTFGGTPIVLAEYNLRRKVHEINRGGAQLARQAADRLSSPDRPRFVAGAMGPTTKAITVTQDGKVFLDTIPVTLAELEQQLVQQRALTPEFPVVVRGDGQVQYQAVVDVLDLLGRLNMTTVGLATKPLVK